MPKMTAEDKYFRRGDAKMKKEKKRTYGRLTVFLSALIIFVSALNVPCYITQYEKNYEVRQLTSELEEEVNRGKRLLIEYKSNVNYKAVEDYVSENLNMKKLANYQVEYVLKHAESNSVVIKDDSNGGFLSGIANTFSVIAEYFR